MFVSLLGPRLTQLRRELPAPPPTYRWSRAALARAASVAPAALARLETQGTGSAATLAAVLRFYQDQGINLAWVLTPDNAQIPRHAFRDVFQPTFFTQASDSLRNLRQLLAPMLTALDTGQLPLPVDVLPLLVRLRRGLSQTLTYLLPPIRLVQTETDLRTYQRWLPPVAAQRAGWRAAASHQAPVHYYEAGDALPRCGSPFYYLADDAGPEDVSDALKCLACRAHLGEAGVSPAFAQPRSRP